MGKQLIVLIMAALLAVPAWPGNAALGFVKETRSAAVSGTPAVAGLTVFDGDRLKVRPGGSLSVALTGGSKALFSAGSGANLSYDGPRVVVGLTSGAAILASSPKSPVEGAVEGVTFRPASADHPSVGWLALNGSGRLVLYAQQGDWLIDTGGSAGSVMLRQGNHAEGPLSDATTANDDQQHKGKHKKLAAVLIGAGLAGLAAGLASGLNPTNFVDCFDPNGQQVCNGKVVSPVTP